MPHYSRLIVEQDGDLMNVRINRPGDRNSIDSTLMDELVQMLVDAETSDVRAIVFRGSGDTYFIGGADGIEMMQCDPDSSRGFLEKNTGAVQPHGIQPAHPGGRHQRALFWRRFRVCHGL